MAVKFSVIIPVWNRSALTHSILAQLNTSVVKHAPEIIIVDNGSIDNTPEMLEWWKKNSELNMIVIHEPENTGFGPGHNTGYEVSTGEYIAFVSNDVGISGDFLSLMPALLDERRLLTGTVLRHDTGWNVFDGHTVQYPEGWFIASSRKIWEELGGGFDERYAPCDYEDMDIGMSCMINKVEMMGGTLPVSHKGFGSTANQLDRLTITHKNREKFYAKWRWWFTGEENKDRVIRTVLPVGDA